MSVVRMAKYSSTPIGYFMEMPLIEFFDWFDVINGEIQRENEEIGNIGKKK